MSFLQRLKRMDWSKAMQEKQYSAVASNAKVLMKLVGLEAKIKS